MAADAARRFAEEGATVFVIGKVEEECQALGLPFAVADLTIEKEAVSAFVAASRELGRLDAVFAVAGGSGRAAGDGPLDSLSLSAWDATLALNATTAFLTSREALRIMLHQPRDSSGLRGSLLLMTSVLAWSPAPAFFTTHAYATAKAAVAGLARALASYYAPAGIRVNAIAPGLVQTPMSARATADPQTMAFVASKQSLRGGILSVADVTELALELCSERSRAVTGQVIAVDGGWSASDAAASLPRDFFDLR